MGNYIYYNKTQSNQIQTDKLKHTFIISRTISNIGPIEVGIYSLKNKLSEGLRVDLNIYCLESIIKTTSDYLLIKGNQIVLELKKIDNNIVYKLSISIPESPEPKIYTNTINETIRSSIKNINVNSAIIDSICLFIKL